MKVFLLLLLFSQISFAQHENCEHHKFNELADLETLAKAIDWTAASDEDIRKAFCTKKTPFTESEMNFWLDDNQSRSNISRKINGVSFENESQENLDAFDLLTTFVDIMGRPIAEKAKEFKSDCKKVSCAIKEIFGNETGTQLLYMQRRFGMNGSHIIKEKDVADAWTKKELDDVLLSLSDFPEGVLPFQKSRTLIHASRAIDSGRTLANAVVTVYSLWNDYGHEQRRSTITHEIGHALAGVSDMDENAKWSSLSKWETTKKMVNGKEVTQTVTHAPDTIVSEYGQTNEREDMAESVVAYRYNPKLLKELSPEKYALIKANLFDNVEYTSEQACQSPNRTSDSIRNIVAAELDKWMPSAEEISQISNRCSELAATMLFEDQSVAFNNSRIQNCYEASIKQQTTEKMLQKVSTYPNPEFLAPMLRNKTVDLPPELVSKIQNQATSQHRMAFNRVLSEAVKKSFFCESIEYSYQDFDSLGFDTYGMRDKLIEVSKRACAGNSNSEKLKTVQSMLK